MVIDDKKWIMGTVYTTRLFLPFLTHGRFVSLRNSFLVSNNTIKTLTTQKSIISLELKYVWVMILKALFVSKKQREVFSVSNEKMKRCSFGIYSLYLFLRATWLFFSGDIAKISDNTTQVSGGMTSGEMTPRRLDRLPITREE